MFLLKKIKTSALNITIEPAIILYFVAFSISGINQQNLLLQKVCHPGDSPPPLTFRCEAEAETQRQVTTIETWKNFLLHVGPVFFVMFAGAWSDNHGKRRKPLMYIPVIGQILADLLCLLNVFFWSWPPELAAATSAIVPALTGWRACFTIGTAAYIADVSSVESRTSRIGVCTALVFLGVPIGGFIFGNMFHKIGLQGMYMIGIVLNLLALFYLLFRIEEVRSSEESSAADSKTSNILDSFTTTFSKRPGNKRWVVLVMVAAAPVTLQPLEGEFTVLYYFLRYKFNWNEVNYGYYAGYKTIVICFGTLISMGIFSRLLRIPDAIIGVMASVTLMMASVGFTFASHTWELYVYPIVDFLQGAALAVVYSIVSKTVESNELGQVSSVIGVVDAVFPLVNLPLYTQVYKQTFTQLPGAFFLLSFVYGAIGLVLFVLVFILMRKQESVKELKDSKHQG